MRERAARADRRAARAGRRGWTATSVDGGRRAAGVDGRGHFTFLGYREYDLAMHDGEDSLRRIPGSGLGILREPRGRARVSADRAGPRARPASRQPLILTKANTPLDRPPARLPGLRRRQALRRRRRGRRRAPLPRPLHDRRLPRASRRHPGRAAQGRGGHRARGLPGRQPRREGARRDPRHLPARRALPDPRGRAVRAGHGHPRPRRAPARAAVRAPRRLRALRHVPRVPPARPLQHAQPRAHPGDPRARRSTPRASTSRCACRSRCSCASTSRVRHPARRACPRTTRPRSSSGSSRRPARGPTSCARRCSRRPARSRAPPATAATATRSRPATARTGSPARRSSTSAGSSGWPTDEEALAVSLYRPLEAADGALRCKLYRRASR